MVFDVCVNAGCLNCRPHLLKTPIKTPVDAYPESKICIKISLNDRFAGYYTNVDIVYMNVNIRRKAKNGEPIGMIFWRK